MTIVGLIVFVVGAAFAGLIFADKAPAFLVDLGFGMGVWVGVALAGAVLMYFNRRPGN